MSVVHGENSNKNVESCQSWRGLLVPSFARKLMRAVTSRVSRILAKSRGVEGGPFWMGFLVPFSRGN